MSAPFRDHGPRLAAEGWAVFPVAPRGKSPLAGSHAYKDATTDALVVAEWARKHPTSNVAVCPDGYLVVDVDHPAEFLTFVAEQGLSPLPLTRTVRTGRTGGFHHYVLLPEGIDPQRPLRGTLPGVDLVGSKKHVLAPGSVHKTGKLYSLARDLPLARLGSDWAEAITRPAPVARPSGARPGGTSGVSSPVGLGLVRTLGVRRPGSGRRAYFSYCLGTAYRDYGGDPELLDRLRTTALEIGLTEGEVDRLTDWFAREYSTNGGSN
ncbi:bifunctional DNA primase/polymerase [Rhodococcus sp. JS3073]|uniref:bifunctional DNA primase/polymerase n=1 Tax=Rhodococcus sp. JS3073 TaxID=3002901 RepID=UPI002286AC49|nr:bifunctional DNA primase/polymerase [Rhodococcus sp. JS3073]WAM17515.1 bifunctional DNA primase/polymerase [Rhodococcus sp. JS3073]